MIRRHSLADVEEMLDHIQQWHSQSRFRKTVFDRQKMKYMLTGNVNNSMFYAALIIDDKSGKIVGGLCASIMAYVWSHEAHAYDHFFYILPDYRTENAATELVENYLEWAHERRVKEAYLQNITGDRVEAFSKFAKKLGFKLIGTTYSREL